MRMALLLTISLLAGCGAPERERAREAEAAASSARRAQAEEQARSVLRAGPTASAPVQLTGGTAQVLLVPYEEPGPLHHIYARTCLIVRTDGQPPAVSCW